MLVLSRRRSTVILIGDDIRITFLDVYAKYVRLRIDCPDSVYLAVHNGIRENPVSRIKGEPVNLSLDLDEELSMGASNMILLGIKGVSGRQARVGFNVPDHITVMREEVIEREAETMRLEQYLGEQQLRT